MISSLNNSKNSKWLDKLRQSRGFPDDESTDLSRFLSLSSTSASANSDQPGTSTRSESTQSESTQHQAPSYDPQWHLCELFNMAGPTEGGSGRLSRGKKGSRKQKNPRHCELTELCDSDELVRVRKERVETGFHCSSGDGYNHSLNDDDESGRRESGVEGDDHDDNGCVKGNDDLKGFSKSEVLVVDTSLKDWKFDGWVFRKNDEWRIKEKRRVFGGYKNKRKLSSDDKEKILKDGFLASNKGQLRNGKEEEPVKKTSDFLAKSPRKRFICPRPPVKSVNEGPSVILLKSIPESSDEGSMKPSKCFQKKRPKMMKIV